MKTLVKKISLLASVVLSLVVLAGCHSPKKQHMDRHHHNNKEVMMRHAYDADKMHAKIYTRSTKGGYSEIGYVKICEKGDNVEMKFHIKEMRPGVVYQPKLANYECKGKSKSDCKMTMDIDVKLPSVKPDAHGVLDMKMVLPDTMIQEFAGKKLIFERDAGYKAAWGMVRPVK